jgi:ribosomal protein L44E
MTEPITLEDLENRYDSVPRVKDLFTDNATLHFSCKKCQRSRKVNLEELIRAHRGNWFVNDLEYRCVNCDNLGQLTVRPPAESAKAAVAYLVPRRT